MGLMPTLRSSALTIIYKLIHVFLPMLRILCLRIACLTWVLIHPVFAHAYIGPGMGLGVAATVLGLFAAFILLLIGLIWLPVRRFFRSRRQKNKKTE
jgi:hypothetical protein